MDRKRLGFVGLVAVGIVTAACGSALDGSDAGTGSASGAATTDPVEAVIEAAPSAGAGGATPVENARSAAGGSGTENVLLTPFGRPAFLPLDASETPNERPIFRTEQLPFSWGFGWKTNFAIRTVDLSEIFSGGTPRDGIPPIDRLKFGSIADQDGLYTDNAPVVQVEINGDVRAYPIAILTWHEIVNDVVGGEPVSVTFCPLCNTAIAFERTINDVVFDFGTSGTLRNSDLVMWDRQTESLCQQIGAEAIVGSMVGAELNLLPAPIVS